MRDFIHEYNSEFTIQNSEFTISNSEFRIPNFELQYIHLSLEGDVEFFLDIDDYRCAQII